MKKIILIVFISLMFSNIVFAKTTLLWVDRIKGKNSSDYLVSTICVDGYIFVVTKSGTTDSISTVQFFIDTMDLHDPDPHNSVPAKC